MAMPIVFWGEHAHQRCCLGKFPDIDKRAVVLGRSASYKMRPCLCDSKLESVLLWVFWIEESRALLRE